MCLCERIFVGGAHSIAKSYFRESAAAKKVTQDNINVNKKRFMLYKS